MKIIVLAVMAVGFAWCGADAQTVDFTVNSFSHLNYTPPQAPVKPVAAKPRKRRIKKVEVPQNFKVCMGSNSYFICDSPKTAYNTTHPRMGLKVGRPAFPLDKFYNTPLASGDDKTVDMAPQPQSYPGKTGDLDANSYIVIYPQKNRIMVGKQHN